MKILVCIKQVPGTSEVEVDPITGVLKRDGVSSKMNPYDLYALELALLLKEKHSAVVEVITMGPNQAVQVLKEAIAMGADQGLLISDRRFAGADVLATAYTLSQALRSTGTYDLILCGKQTTDGDTAQVGAEIAEFLGIPHANNVVKADISENQGVSVAVNMEGYLLTQYIPFPCLLCVEKDINTPRLPSYKRLRALTGEDFSTIQLDSMVDTNPSHYGLEGSPTQVERIFPPEKSISREVLKGNSLLLAQQLFELLQHKKFI